MRGGCDHLVGRRWIENDAALIDRFVHRRAQRGDQTHLAPKLGRIRNRADLDRASVADPKADPGAFGATGEPRDHGHGRGGESAKAERVAKEIERRPRPREQFLLLMGSGVQKAFAHPGDAPLQLTQRRAHGLLSGVAKRYCDHAVRLVLEQDRIADVHDCSLVVLGHATTLAKGKLCDLRQAGRPSDCALRPGRRNVETVGRSAGQQHDSAVGAVDALALKR